MCESAPPRRSARAILAARWVPAMLVAIGLIASGTLVPLGAMEPAGQGRQKERQPTPRWFHSAAVVNDKIYVIGGAASHGSASSQEERTRLRTPLSVVEVYDPASGRWTTKPDLANPRGWLSASVVAGRLYVIGGRSSAPEGGILEVDGALPGIEVYTPPD